MLEALKVDPTCGTPIATTVYVCLTIKIIKDLNETGKKISFLTLEGGPSWQRDLTVHLHLGRPWQTDAERDQVAEFLHQRGYS